MLSYNLKLILLLTAMMNTRHANKTIKKRLWRECKCSLHLLSDSRAHDIKSGRTCPKRFLDRLIEKGYFTAKSRFSIMAKLDTLIASDLTTLHQNRSCKDTNEFFLYNLNTWIYDGPEELVSHSQKVYNLDNSPASQYQLARLIEKIYKSRNSRLVLLLAFNI